jgi:adenine-specific DNA methylase
MEAGLTPDVIIAEAMNWDAHEYTKNDIKNISKVVKPCWLANIPKARPIGV